MRAIPSPKHHAISALAALAQPTRLAIFRLLIKHEPIGITAGVIADTVGAPHNTLSSHLAILVRAGLLRSSRDGRTIVYRSDVNGMQSLISFLINDCCNGHPELCGLLGHRPRRWMRVCANDEESRLKEASCPHKKTGSRPLVLSQCSQIAIASPATPSSRKPFVMHDSAA